LLVLSYPHSRLQPIPSSQYADPQSIARSDRPSRETFVAPLLASRVFFANIMDDNAGLHSVQWTYRGVACFVALLIILFWLAPFPEITDSDQEVLETQIEHEKQYNMFFGICYVGAQVAVAGYSLTFPRKLAKPLQSHTSYMEKTVLNSNSYFLADFLTIAQRLYAFNRFIDTGLMMMKASKLRCMPAAYLILCCCVFSAATMTTKGYASVAMAHDFILSLRGLGHHTKRGGSLLVAAISGGLM
ncbi:Major facilitator superfamily domain general substrate transporter, partial [Penicillium verrucosum]|uniref:Major facilitator superfamily domain general substrate transporter n=1 Tax=Penicillium verrucosum TaxID=60171 RepID=UPI0025455DC3